jgi:RNA polymerase sigma factor (sigma-70 family)
MLLFTERSADTNARSMGSTDRLSEESLVEAAKRGHDVAFATLSERYRQRLLRAAQRITRSSEDAEDAVQDALLRAFVHLADFDGRSSFATWLTRIAINSALMILRKKRASPEIATDYNEDFGPDGQRELADHQPNPERRYAQYEEERMLEKAIQRLRPTLRIVVQIQHLQERSIRETAEAIGISLTAAKGRLFRAHLALRKSLSSNPGHAPQGSNGLRFVRGTEVYARTVFENHPQ